AAVAFPASNRQQRLHARAVDRLRDVSGVRPVELPGLRHGGDGGAVAAVERHDTELHAVAAEQPSAGGVGISGCGGVHIALSSSKPCPLSLPRKREPIFQRPRYKARWVPAFAGTTVVQTA